MNGSNKRELTTLKVVWSMTRRSAAVSKSRVIGVRNGVVSGRKRRTPPRFKIRFAIAVMRASCDSATEARTEERQEPILLP